MSSQLAGSYQRNPKIEEAPLQNELMLFDPESSKFFVLNPTMAWVWQHCGDTELDEMVPAMVESFEGVTPEQASTDLEEALNELRKLGLITDR